ncbi:endonuclease 8-like 1 isoform X3 [Choloepus didactylus]|uniref:endonuclease 8-like 1 isoform X3 n=1 Tax=Choloepus didactylus TaxID=27675 RepID=UPI0018A011C3|nr:endonuclease 8-like 1 isoform X3 [Choloepus didactylus]
MPEGPELHLASQFVNETCGGLVFGGCVEKSAVSRNPEVPFESSAYRISAAARGKELRLTLSPLPGAQPQQEPLALVFRFGMSGSFQVAPSDALPPHAHLRFYTAAPSPQLTLCFVDIRRFGRWDLGGEWQPGRGPCVLLEYEQFRENVLRNLADKAFDRPICEALLDQRFFNGIGNYLRAEILHRSAGQAEDPSLREGPHGAGGCATSQAEPRADSEPENQGQAAESGPAGAVPLGAQGSGPVGGQRLRAGERGGGLCRLSSLAAVLWRAGHELPAGSAWPHHLVPGGKSRKKKSKETQAGPEDQAEGPPTPSKAPPRTRRARRELPKQTAAWEPGGANFQRDPEAPIVPEERKRRARPAASGRLPSASSLPATGSPAEEGGGHAGGRSMGKKVGGRLWGSPRPVGPLVRSLS